MSEWPLEMLDAEALLRFVRLDAISPHVLRLGHEKGIIDDRDVVDIELQRFQNGLVSSGSVEEDLALLLSDDFSRIPELLEAATAAASPRIDPSHVWAYLGAKILRSQWEGRPDAVYVLAGLVESLGMPERYRDLVYYEPRGEGPRQTGSKVRFLQTLDDRLREDDDILGLV